MKNQLAKVRVFLLMVALLFVTLACVCLKGIVAHAANEQATVKGLLQYDTSKYTVTEDYTAYVQSAAYEKNVVKIQDPDDLQKRRLDYGKSGALFTSKATGVDAIGEVFSIDERTGLFTMDFRVFSEKTFAGNIWTDQNTFLDAKKVSVTFTSNTDAEKAFTIYYTAKELDCGLDLNASVAIKGETYNSGNGYGMLLNGSTWQLKEFTYLNGLAFSNFARSTGTTPTTYLNPETQSIQMTFNPETMELFTNTYTVTAFGSAGYNVEEKQQLCRNLALNTIGDTEDKWNANGYEGMLTLNPADFAGGYSISVAVEDMTANNVYGDEAKDYDRYAKVLVYDVCGEKIKTDTVVTATEGTKTIGETEYTSYQFSANTQNELAEDMSVVLDGETFINGSYATVGVAPHYKTMSPYSVALPSGTAVYDLYNGYGDRMYEYDPYSDIRGMELTFRSKTDSSKAFTVYLQSHSVKSGNVIARVGVEGEAYRNGHGSNGFAVYGDSPTYNADGQFRALNGTFGASSGFSGNDNSFVQVRFNPTSMTVEGYAYAKWYTLRDLTKDYAEMDEVASGKFATLQAADFADGFTVEIGVDIMNNNTNRGRTKNYNLWGTYYTAYSGVAGVEGDYIMAEGYDRPAIFDVISFNEGHYHVDIDNDVVCEGCGEYIRTYEKLNSVGLSLNGDIDMHYYMVLSDDLATSETAYLDVALGSKTSQLYVKDAIKDTSSGATLYKFTVSVPAKDASESIRVQIKDGDFVGEVYEYSVKEYIQTIQQDASGKYGAELKGLMGALDVYADSAKNYFNGVAVDATTEMEGVLDSSFAGYETTVSGNDDRVEFIGCSLILKSQTSIRIYFALSEGTAIEDITVTLNEKTLTPIEKAATGNSSTCYYVEVSGILASNLDMEFSVSIGDMTVTTSAMAYAADVVSMTGSQRDDDLVNLMKALYLYNQSANTYFAE